MTPKEKSKELVDKFGNIVLGETINGEPFTMAQESLQESKQCALIAVDEILQANKVWYENSIPYKYWIEVKQEIKKL